MKKYKSGVTRTPTAGKIDYSLALDGPMFERLAIHLTKNAKSHGKRNWLKASSQEDYDRARESFVRHTIQYLKGLTNEDHAASLIFNLNIMELVKGRK